MASAACYGRRPEARLRALATIAIAAVAACGVAPREGAREADPQPEGPSSASTAASSTDGCVTDAEHHAAAVEPLVQERCAGCHVDGGLAGHTRLQITADPGANHAALVALALEDADGTPLLLAKPTGVVLHEGGVPVEPGTPGHAALDELVARAHRPGGCAHPGPWDDPCADGPMDPGAAPALRLTAAWHANAVEDLLGVRPPDDTVPASGGGVGFRHWVDANPVSDVTVEGFLAAAEAVSEAVRADPAPVLGCAAPFACAEAWSRDFAERAFRHPLSADEAALVDALYATGEDPLDGALRVIEGVLQMPQFLYLRLPAADATGDVRPLDDHAIAARLSFVLLGTTPDADLRERAGRGALHTAAQVREVAAAMVDDPRALRGVEAFHEDWLQTAALDAAYRSPERYPAFDDALVASMKEELRRFATDVVWADGAFDALVHSRVTWTDPALDGVYGTVDQRTGDGWERRVLPDDRAGVLGRAAFLAAHADVSDASPVRRGATILSRMLCVDAAPPPDVDVDLDPASDGDTMRERLAAHRDDPACVGCHAAIDPLGFGLDHYGAIGEHRDAYPSGDPVDATGTLASPAGSFDGLDELVLVLDQDRALRDCYARQWLVYALGRPYATTDRCAADRLADRFEHTGGALRDLVVEAVASDAFRTRRVE